ncbi:nucleotidyltransferase family protein [Candidatus Curtissbacteria bacterium]|nr:nucleotidyltransferase family protein [Candidatus Curtissbacteria bacterium]
MKTNVEQIKETLDQNMKLLRDKYGVKQLGVFGSVSRGENIETSDIDLLVEFSKPIGLFKFIELEEYLGELLGNKVDLVTKDALKPAIKEDVLREVIYV